MTGNAGPWCSENWTGSRVQIMGKVAGCKTPRKKDAIIQISCLVGGIPCHHDAVRRRVAVGRYRL